MNSESQGMQIFGVSEFAFSIVVRSLCCELCLNVPFLVFFSLLSLSLLLQLLLLSILVFFSVTFALGDAVIALRPSVDALVVIICYCWLFCRY